MFDFGQANAEQVRAIQTVDGPLLIIAGPGTGKTFTLVKRTLYLIREKGVRPEQILLATFTEKAAKELVTRISNELSRLEVSVNINDMYIGTFHSICSRLIKEYLEQTQVDKNYRCLDAFEQKYMVFRDLISKNSRFGQIRDLYTVLETETPWGSKNSKWDQAGQICQIVNELTEELVAPEDLMADPDRYISTVGRIQACYNALIAQHNHLDFSGMQAQVYRLLREHPHILAQLRKKIRYIMVDEYQDTNYIQEQIVFLLAGEEKNICVVGDDDQGLYRFRGATIRNILKFTEHFAPGACSRENLIQNYRSDPGIVSFYNQWMQPTAEDFRWDGYRLPKTIQAVREGVAGSPTVVKISTEQNETAWQRENLNFVKALLDSGRVTDPNQIAFLFSSVRSKRIRELADYFEQHGIRVYSPRSNLFFAREEVQLLLGCLMLCFPGFVTWAEQDSLRARKAPYYATCLQAAREYLRQPEAAPLRAFIQKTCDVHGSLGKNTAYNFTGLAYRMFAFEPFRSFLGRDMHDDVIALRPARNLSILVSCLGKYEHLNQIDCLKPQWMERDARYLFTSFLNCLNSGGITEYEDQSEYAPSGCVSFLTIHQSKGMEFPVVVVGSLDQSPGEKKADRFDAIRNTYFHRKQFEPADSTGKFDFLRLYYTAFSRAQNLLVLTAKVLQTDKGSEPSQWFREPFARLPSWKSKRFQLGDFSFDTVKNVSLKEAYSFTSHIAVYAECPRRYKFFRELGFTPAGVTATIFGTLIHQTVEDMHKAALRGEAHLITDDQIRTWLSKNYATISESERIFLSPAQREAAVRQALRYARRQQGRWDQIRESEVDISVVKPDYILKGTIDLIRGEGDSVEIVDFKSDKKPDPERDPGRLARYKKQLQIYAHLVEQRAGIPVSRLHLYYTGDESDTPTISFDNDPVDVEETIREFDGVAHRIMEKDFAGKAVDPASCESCDFRPYCESVDQRTPVTVGLSPSDWEAKWALATAGQKHARQNSGRKYRDIFLDDLAKNLVKTWLSKQEDLSITDYDALRKDGFSAADNYDLAVNGFQVEVRAYLEKRPDLTARELLSRRRLFLRKGAPDLTVQVIFSPGKALAKQTEPDKLAAELCGSCTAHLMGWVSAEEQAAALSEGKTDIPLSDTGDMPELIDLLRRNQGPLQLCPLCGAIKVQRINRSTGEAFWGCPHYKLHK